MFRLYPNRSKLSEGPLVDLLHIGMSTETTVFARVDITLAQGTEDFPTPKQKLDEGEFVSRSFLSN